MRHVSCQEKEKFHERISQKASTHSTTADAKVKCRLCEGTHKAKTCKTCKETTVKGRWEITQKNKLCYRCLGPGHLGKACQGSNRWNVDNWGGTHHFHLHVECQERASEHNRKGEIATTSSSFGASGNRLETPESVMLWTVPVWLLGTRGQRIQGNAFLDDGSDTMYVQDYVTTALGFWAEDGHLRVSTLTDHDRAKKPNSLARHWEPGQMNKRYNPCMDNGKDVPWFTNPELESTRGSI